MGIAEPTIRVGICAAAKIKIRLCGKFAEVGNDSLQTERAESGYKEIADAQLVLTPDNCTRYLPLDKESYFEIEDVTIGIGFHWERKEVQRFKGILSAEVYADNPGLVTVVNEIGIEAYLESVISSEMSANAGKNLLEAHAVVSRSWLLCQLENRNRPGNGAHEWRKSTLTSGQTVDELVCWYDREQHSHFDVCADDHCQRYQGITRQTNKNVREAVAATRGLVLTFGGKICDARFSKCCGGITERFENCWENSPKEYLVHLRDSDGGSDFCDTTDEVVLRQVLNSYDMETKDFYRWQVSYSGEELGRLIHEKSGVAVGEVLALNPLERTEAGRITRLLIEGSLQSVIVGKELEIRRWLSHSHLRSAIFDVSRSSDGRFVLTGRGWGHGVGMCQIGAAVMGAKGYTWREITAHYFPKTEVRKIY